jgi:hypothetical protein
MMWSTLRSRMAVLVVVWSLGSVPCAALNTLTFGLDGRTWKAANVRETVLTKLVKVEARLTEMRRRAAELQKVFRR